MKHYYYSVNDEQLGPFTFEELKSKKIKKTTLVWTDGMEEWMPASSVAELSEIIISEPPPLPKKQELSTNSTISETNSSNKNFNIIQSPSQYDESYKRTYGEVIFGFLILITPLVVSNIGLIDYSSSEAYGRSRMIWAVIALIIRIIVTYFVVSFVKKLNRKPTIWGWAAFIFPGVTLIVLGFMKKLKLKVRVDSSLPKTKQVESLLTQADEMYNAQRYDECIEIYNAASTIDSEDAEIIRRRGITYYKMENFDSAYDDFQFVYKKHPTNSRVNYYLGNLELRKKNIDQAVKHWLIAKENGNEDSESSLNHYWNYKDKYLLSKEAIRQKLDMLVGFKNDGVGFLFEKLSYLGDLKELGSSWTDNKVKTMGYVNRLGLALNIKNGREASTLGISYHEMEDIDYSQSEKIIIIKLTNSETIRFSFDLGSDVLGQLKQLCEKHYKATGQKISATRLWDRSVA